MNHQFSRTQFPNGGWMYYDPRIGWTAPSPKGSTFDQTVHQIIAVRKKNPAIVAKHNLSLDPVNVGNELEEYTRRRLGISNPQPVPPSVLLPGESKQVVNSPTDIRKLALGMGLLLAWERSSEGPVSLEVANYRAQKCAACPKNSIGKLEDWRKSQVGATARSKTLRTSNLAHKTPFSEDLGLCEGCYAPTQQLCSMPMGLIAIRMGEKELVAMDTQCWVRV